MAEGHPRLRRYSPPTMATWKRLTEFVVRMPHRAGELARLTAQLREADVAMLGFWGPTPGRSADGVHCVPERAEQFRNFSRSADLTVWEEPCFWITEQFKGGNLVATLDLIAGAGINIDLIQAMALQGQFGCFVWVADEDTERLEQLLMKA